MVEALKIMWRRVMHVVSFAPCPIVSVTGVHMPETCCRYDTVTAAGADASCISRVFLLLSSLYHRIHAHGSALPYRCREFG